MALDPEYFQLKAALFEVWNNTELLSDAHKKLIQTALPSTSESIYPEGEEQLNDIQIAILASEVLKKYETEEAPWLNQNSRDIVTAFRKFIHGVSLYFHKSAKSLPDSFLAPLIDYIKTSKSHIATLNYDNLLYDPLCTKEIMNGYNGVLIDGFRGGTLERKTFAPKNLARFDNNKGKLAWFLHLHGSPLFVGNQKCAGNERIALEANEACHIVLTHVTHKRFAIQTSDILSEYWAFLDKALEESASIILFGYSGNDIHLNEAIAKHHAKHITVIEWRGAGAKEERTHFWSHILGSSTLHLVQEANILDFKDWRATQFIEIASYRSTHSVNTVGSTQT